MEFFRIRRDIPFMRHALVFNIISLVTFLAAVFFLFTRGLHLSIEFTGGTVVQVAYNHAADIAKVRQTVDALGFGEVQVQNFGTPRDVLSGSLTYTTQVNKVFGGEWLTVEDVVASVRLPDR